MVDALLELYSPFLKGGNSAVIAAIASATFYKNEFIGHLANYSGVYRSGNRPVAA